MKHLLKYLFVCCICILNMNAVLQSASCIKGKIMYSLPYHRDARFVYGTTPAGYLPQRGVSLPHYYNGKCMGEMQRFDGHKIICSDKGRVEYDWIMPIKTEHLFKVTPQNKNAVIEIVVTDRFRHI